MKFTTAIFLLTILSTVTFSQTFTLKNRPGFVFLDAEMTNRKMRGIDYWIIDHDAITMTRLDFAPIYAGSTIDLCSKGDTLGPTFWTISNFHPFNQFTSIEQEVLNLKNLKQQFVSQGRQVSVYEVMLSGQFCKCAYRDFDGEIIPLYIPLKDVTVSSAQGLTTGKDLTNFDFHFFRDVERIQK
jgi:hypothetical protein